MPEKRKRTHSQYPSPSAVQMVNRSVFPDAGTFSAKTRPVPSKLSSQALWVTRDVSVTFAGRGRCTASLWGYTHHWPNSSYSHSMYPQRSGCHLRSRIHDEHKAPWVPPANLILTLCSPLKFVRWKCSSLSIKSIIIFQSGVSITLRNNVKYKNTGGNVLSFLNWNSHFLIIMLIIKTRKFRPNTVFSVPFSKGRQRRTNVENLHCAE